MATVKIRGRIDTIELDNVRGQNLKNRKFGLNNTAKADPLELVDLGEWAGEYGRIVEIIIPKRHEPATVEDLAKQKEAEAEAKFLKLDPAEKARQRTGLFKLQYAMRIGVLKAQPPEALLKKVVEALTVYFTENPNELHASVKAFEDLLPPKTDKSVSRMGLAKKMSTEDKAVANGLKCKKCGTELKGNLREYCSGSCMLAAQNGEISPS